MRGLTGTETGQASGDLARAQRRLDRWRNQPPFDVDGYFQERLGLENLDEEELLSLLLEAEIPPGDNLAKLTPWFDELERIYHAHPRAVSGAVEERANPSRPIERFGAILDPLVVEARAQLQGKVAAFAADPLISLSPENGLLLFVDLRQQLWLAVNRALVLELNIARLEGSLSGDTPEERFEAFTRRFAEPEYCCAFFAEYPVLARAVIGMVERAVEGRAEFIERLRNDWTQIEATFPELPGADRVVDVSFGAGDLHRGGRSVAILTFNSGTRLVYKPKPLAIDLHFEQLLRWLETKDERIAHRGLGILDRGVYGWVEFVAPKPCASQEEVRRFYWRQGAYLATLHCLAGTDVHYQNLIAAGEWPMLVDLETLFHPPLPFESDKHNQFVADAIRSSVLAVGLLPLEVLVDEDGRGADFSGLGGGGSEQFSAAPVAHWDDASTDRMRIVRKRAKVLPGTNRATFEARETVAKDYEEDILAGFSTAYLIFLRNKAVLASDESPLDVFAGDQTRVVLRSTRTYGGVLSQSYHPDFLRDALDRQRFLDQLWISVKNQEFLRKVIRIECDNLFEGDIPFFAGRVDSSDLFVSSTQSVQDFFPEPALSLVKRRISQLSERDLQRQLSLIEASLVAASAARSDTGTDIEISKDEPSPIPESSPAVTESVLRQSSLEAAKAVGDKLVSLAIAGPDGQASWISLLSKRGNWRLAGLGEDLYFGLPGVIFFLAYLGQATGNEQYRALAESALRTLLGRLPKYLEKEGKVGAFDGSGGIIYLLTHLGTLWKRADLIDRAQGILPLLPELIENDPHLDVIAGVAGCAASIMCLHEQVPSEQALGLLQKCGDRLVQQAQDMPGGKAWLTSMALRIPLAGFSHGVAGIAWALLRLADLFENERYRLTAIAAMEYEHRLFLPEFNNWPDNREDLGKEHEAKELEVTPRLLISAWCHGATGIGLGRLPALTTHRLEVARIDVARAVTRTLADPLRTNHSLCHGNLGNLDFLIQAAAVVRLPDRAIENRTNGILHSIESRGLRGDVPRGAEVPSLMRGFSGIGYGLLRAALPSRIPSVLTLDGPRKENGSAS
jgi:type 2 lantibiotic biosynthesis protein LanM